MFLLLDHGSFAAAQKLSAPADGYPAE